MLNSSTEFKIPAKLDLIKIRQDFPILDSSINGKKLIYLDNAATTHKPLCYKSHERLHAK